MGYLFTHIHPILYSHLLTFGTLKSPTTSPSSMRVSRVPPDTRSVAVACVLAPALAFSLGMCGDRITNGRWRARAAHGYLHPVSHGLFSTWCAKPSVEHVDSNSAPYMRARKPLGSRGASTKIQWRKQVHVRVQYIRGWVKNCPLINSKISRFPPLLSLRIWILYRGWFSGQLQSMTVHAHTRTY